MFENLHVAITLGAPLAVSHNVSLDAILGGILFQNGMSGPEASRVPMVDRYKNIPMASDALTSPSSKIGSVVRNRSAARLAVNTDFLRRVDNSKMSRKDKASGYIAGIADGPMPNKRNDSKGVDYSFGTVGRVVHTPEVHFLVRGNAAEIEKLLRRAGFIGAWRGSGHGQIVDVEIEELDNDNPLFGIVSGDRLLRTVPADMEEFSGHEKRIMVGRFESPYSPYLAKKLGYELQPVWCIPPMSPEENIFNIDLVS